MINRYFKAVARMTRDGRSWMVTIGHYSSFEDADRAAHRFAEKYDYCDWVQVLDDERGI